MHRTQSTLTRRFLGLMLATTLAAAAIVASAGTAGASESSDLSVRQTFAINTAADTVRITEHVSNAGPSDAQYVTLVALFKTTSSPPGFLPSRGLPCQFQTPPRGWNYMLTCEDQAPIASGATWKPRLTLTGDPGTTLTERVSIGSLLPDPDGTNNLSTLRTGFGAADLSVTESVTPTHFLGVANTAEVVHNRGPETATSIVFDVMLAAPGGSGNWTSDQSGAQCTAETPPAGYDAATRCTLDTLAPNASWEIHGGIQGTSGETVRQDVSVTSAVFDPNPGNSSASTTATV